MTAIDAPGPAAGRYSPIDRDMIDRGEYLVELLACGSCHTNGAFDGIPDMSRPLAGSDTGIGRHGTGRLVTMPWQGYAKMTDDDVDAIVLYLRSIKPIKHKVPDPVEVGEKAQKPFVYFGVYRSKR